MNREEQRERCEVAPLLEFGVYDTPTYHECCRVYGRLVELCSDCAFDYCRNIKWLDFNTIEREE